MNKLQLFYVYKFTSARLKEYNYNINITVNEARLNGELVSIGDNQVLRTIRKITNSKYMPEEINMLEDQKKVLIKAESNGDNAKSLEDVKNKIDSFLHIPEYISVVINSKSDYKNIIKNGIIINGIRFVRLICGASHSRKNTVIFCAEQIEKELKIILQNNMKKMKLSHSKYNAYFALYSSATHVVRSPRVCVIPDKIIQREELVDWVEEREDGDTVEPKTVSLEFNLWDGMGIISPRFARLWAKDLGITDYVPSAFTIRNSFIKGMACTIPFHAFGRLVAKKLNAINDVWGNPINDIRKYDLVLTASQFKQWSAFDSWETFEQNCRDNDITWGISRVTPKDEKKNAFTNYQYIQAINLDSASIKNLCQPTVDWIQDVCGLDIYKSMLFMSGNSIEKHVANNVLDIKKIGNDIVKALILNPDIINDPYVKNKIYNLITKKIKESYIGKLVVDGNYQVMISDPYAFCEYLFGMEIKGLLEDKQHYSYYWNQLEVDTVVAMRSPLTWRSEVNKLNLQNNATIDKWFKYINSGIIYNVHGVDCMLAADSDYDFDIVMTTNCPEFVNNCYGGLPITYKKNPTPKANFDEDLLYLSDLYAFDSKIGQVTNYSTSLYCMLAEYEENSPEYDELIKRLKICRKEQGSQIDKAKGIMVKKFPRNWIKEQLILDDDTEEVKQNKIFMNKLVIKKKPYFMRWLYPKYNRQYKKYRNNAETYCQINFGCGIDKLLQKDIKDDNEQKYIDSYNKYLPLNEADCIMNQLAKYMESIKYNLTQFINDKTSFNYKLLIDEDIPIDTEIFNKVLKIYKDFNDSKYLYNTAKESEVCDNTETKDGFNEDEFNDLQEVYKYYKDQLYAICSNAKQLANIAVDICYKRYPNSNKDFVWQLCSYGLIENIKKHKQSQLFVPIRNDSGSILYLSETYNLQEVAVI